MSFGGVDIEPSKSRGLTSVKATSIQALSQKNILVLDSAGNLHLLSFPNSVTGPDMTSHMRQLPQVLNVQKLAVLPDSSSGSLPPLICAKLFDVLMVEN